MMLVTRTRRGRTLLVALSTSAALLVGCGGEDSGSEAETMTKRERELFDQQRAVCRTEQRINSIEYRRQDGGTNPEHYAEYAAEHGFFEVRDDGERQAAIEGCLAGLE